MIHLAMVEDDPRFRDAVDEAVSETDDIRLTACAADLRQGMALLGTPPADVLLVDLGLPDGSGLELIPCARRLWPDCVVMVATLFSDEEQVVAAIRAGAAGYLLKDTTSRGMAEEIRQVHRGGSPISPMIARFLLDLIRQPPAPGGIADRADPASLTDTGSDPEVVRLSPREEQVLSLIARGHAMGDIADQLCLSPWTVQTYIRRIYEKLGVTSRVAALNEAYRRRLIDQAQ